MFRWFEKRLDPFPAEEPVEPPKTLVAFCVHYTRGAWPYIIVDAVLVTAIAFTEVWMFGFLGRIVDWLSGQNRETFRRPKLELAVWPSSPCSHCRARYGCIRCSTRTLMGNYPMHPLAGAPLFAQAVDDLLSG